MRTRALLLAAGVLVAACGEEAPGEGAAAAPAVDVSVVRIASAPGGASYPATVRALEAADVSTRMSGTLERVSVEVGTPVRAGDTLAVLDGSDVRARIEAAAAQAELADRTFRRIQALASDRAASEQELDEATARRDAARAGLADARAQLGYTVLRAPFHGVVTARLADPGNLAVPGRPVVTLRGTGGVKAVADLPGRLAGTVEVGSEVVLVHPRTDARLEARVARVVPSLTAASRRFRVEVAMGPVSGGHALPGEYLRLHLERPEESSWWVPVGAVVEQGQLRGLYLVEGDSLRLRWVRTGLDRDGAVEILAGAGPGDRVVMDPAPDLRDGTPVGEVREIRWPGPDSGSEGAADAAPSVDGEVAR